mmetsp:Transcript_85573/g.276153  ORF Transcript_85573/g.276153 Transcript_85573/m.276153 type:complete len:209 (+) Transcript_85573:531-1157(+)
MHHPGAWVVSSDSEYDVRVGGRCESVHACDDRNRLIEGSEPAEGDGKVEGAGIEATPPPGLWVQPAVADDVQIVAVRVPRMLLALPIDENHLIGLRRCSVVSQALHEGKALWVRCAVQVGQGATKKAAEHYRLRWCSQRRVAVGVERAVVHGPPLILQAEMRLCTAQVVPPIAAASDADQQPLYRGPRHQRPRLRPSRRRASAQAPPW